MVMESNHVLGAMTHTWRILDAYYGKSDLRKVESNNENLTEYKRNEIHNLLTKYKLLFNIALDTQKNPVCIELQPGTKPHHSKPYPALRVHEAIFKREVEHIYQLGVLKKVNRL